MTSADILPLLPLLIVGYGSAVLMLLAAFRPRHWVMLASTLVVLAASFASLFAASAVAPRTIGTLLRVDYFSLYFTGLVLAGGFLVALLAYDYLPKGSVPLSSFYVLLALAVAGMVAIVQSAQFVPFFLGVEVLSLSLYGLVGYTRGRKQSLEGAMKYLVLAATSSAFLLLGIALVYADTGTMVFERLFSTAYADGLSYVSVLGVALILVVFGFKLAVVPFHMWSPDVYQGAPAPVTALIATGSKGAVLALLLRLVVTGGLLNDRRVFVAIAAFAIATMTIGNLLALLQTNVKRLLAYSSIAHIGYLLIPLLAVGAMGPPSIAFYLAVYFATTIAAFGVVAVVSASRQMGDPEDVRDYRGLASRRPALAAVFALALLSLTGIPPTAGFVAKFYIFSAAADAGLWGLLIAGIVNSGISAFYYLHLVVAMFLSPEKDSEPPPGARPLSAIALAACGVVVLGIGLYPTPLIRLAEAAMNSLRLMTYP